MRIIRLVELVVGAASALAIASACGSGDQPGAGAGQGAPEKSAQQVSPPAPAPTPAPAPAVPAPVVPKADVAAIVAAGSAAKGQPLYVSYCATCHGARGGGDGPLAATLQPPPAHHDDGNYMNPLSNEHLFKVIKLGGAATGKSAMMAPWGGTLSDAQIGDVIAFIRSLADPPYAP